MKKLILFSLFFYCFIFLANGQNMTMPGTYVFENRATFKNGITVPIEKDLILGVESNANYRLSLRGYSNGDGYINYGNVLYLVRSQSSSNPSVSLSGGTYSSILTLRNPATNNNTANNRFEFSFEGTNSTSGNSHIKYAGTLYFTGGTASTIKMAALAKGVDSNGTPTSTFSLGDATNTNKSIRLITYDKGSYVDSYIVNSGGPIYITPKSGSPVAVFKSSGLDVKGTIKALQLEVTTVGWWADFVFSNNYSLPSLSEVKSHIKEHKHLPNIPSEKEVKEKGINLADMQARLLQKIEELTLYTIQQQEMIDALKEKVENLENK